MTSDRYLERFIGLLESSLKLARAEAMTLRKDLEFYRGKCERLELAVMNQREGSGKEFVERTDRGTANDRKRQPITEVPTQQGRIKFSAVRDQWNSLSATEQEEALKNRDMVVQKEGTA